MSSSGKSRRRFLRESAAALAGVVAGAVPAYSQASPSIRETPAKEDGEGYGRRSRFENLARVAMVESRLAKVPIKENHDVLLTPIQDQMAIITPSGLHYEISHAEVEVPDIDPRQHRLLIHGMVDRPLIFNLEELKRLPSVSRIHFVECNSNTRGSVLGVENMRTAQYTHGLASCSVWTGVPLSVLLREAGVQEGAGWIIAEGAESMKWARSIPLSKAMLDGMVAYGQNGEAVRREQGYPLRLLLPGWEGGNNVKWLRRIKVVDQPYMSYMEARLYIEKRRPADGWLWFRFEMGPKSVITRPSGGQQLPGPGYYEITGFAWSGGGVVRRVEVSTDGGRTWKDAHLHEPVLTMAFTRFSLNWNWEGEETVLQSRCTDELGQIQPTLAEYARAVLGPEARPYPPGYPGDIEGETHGHCNAIQPWRVNRDGSVHNAMYR
jgi:sulfane dehydrogenase subunit SoxC